jgi:hypothetical protein
LGVRVNKAGDAFAAEKISNYFGLGLEVEPLHFLIGG